MLQGSLDVRINFGRLFISQGLQLTNVFLSLTHGTKLISLIRLDGALAYLEIVASLIDTKFLAVSVSHHRLARSSSSPHFISIRVLLLLTDVSDCRIEVLPEGLHTGDVLPLVKLFVAQSNLVSLNVNIGCELLSIQIVDDSVNIIFLVSDWMSGAHMHRRFLD